MEIEADCGLWSAFNSFKEEEKRKTEEEKRGDVLTTEQDEPTLVACQHCGSAKIGLDDGNYVCFDCGTIYDKFIDSHAEWRYYGYEDSKGTDPTRCGLPTNELLPDSSLGTIIGNRYGECYEMRMIRKYQMWGSMTYKERTLYNVFDTLTINAVNNGIPASIIDEAKALYKKVSELQLSRGDNRSGLIASAIYISCKTNNVPRSAKEIARFFNLKPTVMTKGCKRFQEILRMELASSSAGDFIHRFASKLNLDKHAKDMCVHVVHEADQLNVICSNTPPSIAAGVIYLVCVMCKIPIEKKDMAVACEVSAVTLSKCYKKLYKYRMYLFTPEMIAEHSME